MKLQPQLSELPISSKSCALAPEQKNAISVRDKMMFFMTFQLVGYDYVKPIPTLFLLHDHKRLFS
jgi:hypothetical protein